MTGLFTFLQTIISQILQEYAVDTAVAMFEILLPALICGTTIYIMIFGYMVATGSVKHSMHEFIKRVLVIAFVIGIAYTEDMYQILVIQFADGFEQYLLKLIQVPSSIDQQNGVMAYLDSTFAAGMAQAYTAIQLASNESDKISLGTFFSQFGCGMIIAIATMILPLYCAMYLLIARIAITLLLAIGPIFIFCSLYPATRQYFAKWLGLLWTYILTYVLMTFMSLFALTIFNLMVGAIQIVDGQTNFILVAFQTLVVSIILVAIVFQVPSIAAGLCGSGGILNPSGAFYAVTSPAQTAAGSKNAIAPGKVGLPSSAPMTKGGGGNGGAPSMGADMNGAVANAAYATKGFGNKGWDNL
jgi:type IV secretion system protein VirB6